MFKIFFFLGLVAMAYSVPAPAPEPVPAPGPAPAAKPDIIHSVYSTYSTPVRFYVQPEAAPAQYTYSAPLTYSTYSYVPNYNTYKTYTTY